MRYVSAILLCFVMLCSISGCAKKSVTNSSSLGASGATESPAATDSPAAAPSPAPTPPFGELAFGSQLDLAFTPVCSSAPAGAGPQSGYTLSFGVTDDVSYGKLHIPDFTGSDGTYNETATLLAQDPSFAIVLKRDSLVAERSSSITTTISEHGLKGSTQLGNFQLDGTIVDAGTVTWECAELSQ